MKQRTVILVGFLIFALLAGTWFLGEEEKPAAQNTETAEPAIAATPEITAKPIPDAKAEPSETSEPTPFPETLTETPSPTENIEPESEPTVILPTAEPTVSPTPAAVAEDGSFTVTLSVRCDTLLENMDRLAAEKHELVPPSGEIFPAADVTAYEGESVFNVLRREMKGAGIHMEFMNTPVYNAAYIEGLHNLYEFDAGELSGWLYQVNGDIPNYGSSRYLLAPGDKIEWHYTCDLGRDIDENWTGGLQKEE